MPFLVTGYVEPEKQPPKAVAVADPESGVIGSVVKLNGFSSSDPEGNSLTYKWEFIGVPIGSSVVQEGFRKLDDNGALVTFSPDVVGDYSVRLTVSNGLFEDTDQREISIRAIIVPHGQGIVPDGKFIWSYLRDVWQQVEGKEWFETLWSALIQIAGAELLSLYQTDFNKSIRDIQDLCQRRWQSFNPRLDLVEDDCTFYLGHHAAGTGATTENLGLEARAVVLAKDNVVVVKGSVLPNVFDQTVSINYSRNPANIGPYGLIGVNQAKNGYALSDRIPDETADRVLQDIEFEFDFQNKAWHFGQDAKKLNLLERIAKYDFTPDQLIHWEGQGGFTYTKGQATAWENEVTLTGATLVTDKILPGYYIGFGSKSPQPRTEVVDGQNVIVDPGVQAWYEIKTVDGEGALTTVENPHFAPVGDYCIVRDAMDFSIRVGDVIYYPSGKNAGLYLVTKAAGTYVEVDRAPAGSSVENGAVRASVYRPVPVTVSQPDSVTTGTFAIPMRQSQDLTEVASGRVITVGGRTFTLLRAVNDVRQEVPLTIVMTNEGDLISDQRSLSWRVPHMLSSKSQNFEEMGVSPGDLLLLDVTNSVSQTHSEVRAQVIGVIGNKLGFVLTDEEVVPGNVPAIPYRTFETLSTDLGIRRVAKALDGSLALTEDAKAILDYVSSAHFKRRYWNKPLTSATDFEILGGTFRVHPKAIVRNLRLPVDSTLRSVPLLQERIAPKDDAGAVAAENVDYVIDGGVVFSGEMTFRPGSSILEVEGGHFIGRGITAGDTFEIESPMALVGSFRVVRVLSDDRLTLSRPIPKHPVLDPVTARITVRRAAKGSFLRFYPGTFTAMNPAPSRLWAESALYDNSDAIEKNFGILVGLTKQDLERVSKDINYRQAVAGLMFAYTRGSAMNKLRLGAQILLGLPFAEHAGIIRSIENDYRLNASGAAVMGRILVEDTDAAGKPQGTMRVYTFPLDPESEKLTGVDTNPATGKPYAVGDTVEIFAALCKGVEVNDYLTSPLASTMPAAFQLQQFHSFRLRANDNIFSLEEMELVSQFLRRITPSYIAYIVEMATELQDAVSITDIVRIAILNRNVGMMADNIGLHLPFALTFDSRSYDGKPQIRWGDGSFWIRKSGNLSTTQKADLADPTTVTIPGLSTVSVDGSLVRAGDVLFILDGTDEGTYIISAVAGDVLTLSNAPSGFQEATNLTYAIGRNLGADLRSGTLNVVAGVPYLGAGLLTDGVTIGDWLLVQKDGVANRYTITGVRETDVGSGIFDALDLLEAIPDVADAIYRIVRPQLIESPYHRTATLVSNGSQWTSLSDPLLGAMMDPTDELVVTQPGYANLFITDPDTLNVVPVLPAGSYEVRLAKRDHLPESTCFGTLGKFAPWDELYLKLKGTGASCTAGSALVSMDTLTLPLPGDGLEITSGPNAGSYRIVEVSPAGVKLSQVLASADAAMSWTLVRRSLPPGLDQAYVVTPTEEEWVQGPLAISGNTTERGVDVLLFDGNDSIISVTPVSEDGSYSTTI